ncbi:Farnesyltransferase beta subunit [Operophtera brumata]|uniref:Protein farnesyltransferase subunit beta n=1 Tax=Operophtera brumata TaxID=104452 RepID=A0A0L7KSY6_OPEBR|nr:Farnesyltransferase beta subunit [Operophtera brumata]
MHSIIRCYAEIDIEAFDFEKVHTDTSGDQMDVEHTIKKIYRQFERESSIDPELPKLKKNLHIKLLKSWLKDLPKNYECLDASRTWLIYWILHSLWILNDMPDSETLSQCVEFIKKCQHEEGGYGGGYLQFPHLGTTYAAVNALSIIGTDEAYDSIDRSSLQKFLWTVRDVDGSFALHRGGEQDIRGVYCAISIAKITNIYTDTLFDKTAEWVVSCQTYEGGFAGCPGMEAHGGYAFCGVATLALLNRTQLCDVDALLRWSVNRQMRLEGGFQGRTNKLVDGCYSFWQGAAFPIISAILSKQENKELIETVFFDQGALQEYIIICCQGPEGVGDPFVIGCPSNELNRVHPLHNVAPHFVYNAVHYFIRHPPPVKDKN